MAIEMSSDIARCFKCGAKYGRRKGYFPVSYAILHKGVGYIPVCKECIDDMYNMYLSQCNNAKDAVRQLCRKLDLYWSPSVYDIVSKKSTPRSTMTQYIAKINSVSYAGKSYDDTLSDEGTLWNFGAEPAKITEHDEPELTYDDVCNVEIPEEWISFWGSGYSYDMYEELERRRSYYISKLPKNTELDIGSEVLIKQICNLEVNIAKDSAAGRSIDKSVNSLNTLLGSLNLKPAQRKNDDLETELSSTPLGVWLYRFENKRPLPDIDDNFKDKNHIKKYIFTWMGHIGKLLNIKNAYTKLYDEEIERLRVEKPEYANEDDEDLLIDAYSNNKAGGESDG